MELVKEKVEEYLKLDSKVVKEIYKYVDKLADFKYRVPIETLQTRHKGYEIEDFVQESVAIVTKAFETKKFPSLPKLKSFINLTMEYHYLKEKRKYWYTHRGEAKVTSFDDPITEFMTVGDTISYDNKSNNDIYDLYNLAQKNLYVIFDWKTYRVCTIQELKKYNTGMAISVNYFIQCQRELGMRDTCNNYKNNNFYMTQGMFEKLSEAIINYIKEHELITIENERPKYIPRVLNIPEQIIEEPKHGELKIYFTNPIKPVLIKS